MKVWFRFFVALCFVFLHVNPLSAQWTPMNTNLGSLKITGLGLVGATLYAGTSDKGLFTSTDNGNSWNTYSGNSTLPSLSINCIDGDMTGQGIFIYTQNGMASLQLSVSLFVPPFVQPLANKDLTLYRQYQSPSRRRIIGTKNAGIYYTDDDNTWTEGTGIPAGTSKNIRGFISQDITVLALVGTENGAFKSTDRGATWTDANTGLSGNALKINNMFSIFALTGNGIYLTMPPAFTGWTTAVATGDYRTCASDLISGKYYFFGSAVGTSIDLNTSAVKTLSLGGISGGIITSALLFGSNIFVGTETGGVFKASVSTLTGVNEKNEVPGSYTLSQNYPNPFNPSTTISFSLPATSLVSLKIFDALGREVVNLISEKMAGGTYTKQWNASGFPSGIYFCRLSAVPSDGRMYNHEKQTGSLTMTKKLVLLQ